MLTVGEGTFSEDRNIFLAVSDSEADRPLLESKILNLH